MATIREQADELLSIVNDNLIDPELLAACRKLRDIAGESDDLDRRFRAAAEDVRDILMARMNGVK